MFRRKTPSIFRFGTLIIGILAVLIVRDASADQPNAAQVGDETEEQESLDVRYARAHLKLATFDFRRVLAERARHPDLLPASATEELQRHVAIDREQLKQALKGPDGDLHQIYLRSAGIAVELAKADLKRKQRSFESMPTETGAMELDRAKAVLEVAQLHLQITKEKKSSLSSMMYLQWQIEVLRNQILDLQIEVKQLARAIR